MVAMLHPTVRPRVNARVPCQIPCAFSVHMKGGFGKLWNGFSCSSFVDNETCREKSFAGKIFGDSWP